MHSFDLSLATNLQQLAFECFLDLFDFRFQLPMGQSRNLIDLHRVAGDEGLSA
jgi:hypothetical protein